LRDFNFLLEFNLSQQLTKNTFFSQKIALKSCKMSVLYVPSYKFNSSDFKITYKTGEKNGGPYFTVIKAFIKVLIFLCLIGFRWCKKWASSFDETPSKLK
jgi:hypothetical protein